MSNQKSDLEYDLTVYITRQLQSKLGKIRAVFRRSPKSVSRYLYLQHKDKGIGVRVSDHHMPFVIRAIQFYTRCKDVKAFYIDTGSRDPDIIEAEVNAALNEAAKFLQE